MCIHFFVFTPLNLECLFSVYGFYMLLLENRILRILVSKHFSGFRVLMGIGYLTETSERI